MDEKNEKQESKAPESIPEEWVDKLFACMGEWYGERWERPIVNPTTKSFMKTVWKNGLVGLTYDEIKSALMLCKRHAQQPGVYPPHIMEFFHYAKGIRQPLIDYHPNASQKIDREVGRKYMNEIRKKLGMKAAVEMMNRLAK